jgi:hypothetical protein
VQCTTDAVSGNFDLEQRALVFVVRASMSMPSIINDIAMAAQNIATYYGDNHPGYFQTFLLATFINGSKSITYFFRITKF